MKQLLSGHAMLTMLRKDAYFPGSSTCACIRKGMWLIMNRESIAIRPCCKQEYAV
ncbi:hypothetical protein [Paraflavitalea soli]|uniref:hypothetical protein n=1 Tax=Paraflavitalea soli TaxID=2315862 RepID=UPI0013C41EEA|nr:hypothetical protein [Paraflavitalea soli]